MEIETREMLPDLLHGKLDASARARVEKHVAGCGECREELEVLRTVKAAAIFAPTIDVNRVVGHIAPYAKIAEKQRGLLFEHPVAVRFQDPAAFEKSVRVDQAKLDADDKKEIQEFSALMRAFGLISGDVDLYKAFKDAYGGDAGTPDHVLDGRGHHPPRRAAAERAWAICSGLPEIASAATPGASSGRTRQPAARRSRPGS